MSSPVSEERDLARNRRTLLLLLAGSTSLLIPLAGVVYIRATETRKAALPPGASALVFERRGPDAPLLPPLPVPTPKQNLAGKPALPANANSLSFVRGGNDYYQETPAAAPAPARPAPPQAPQAWPTPPARKTAAVAKAKPGYKEFAQPHLNKTGYSSRGLQTGHGNGNGNGGTTTAGAPPLSDVMKKLGSGSGGGGSSPDVNALLQNLPSQ